MTTPSDDCPNRDEYPETLASLVGLYYDRYKPLYSRVQTFNEFPVELVFEIAAAWDHLSRHWHYGESEIACVDKAARHIKRAVFDAYKLLLKQTVDDYEELRNIDTSLIDNGRYDLRLRQLMSEIREESIAARTAEGDTSGPDGWSRAFALWGGVHQKIEVFRKDYYLNPSVEWARRKTAEFAKKRRRDGFLLGVLSSATAALICWAIVWTVSRIAGGH